MTLVLQLPHNLNNHGIVLAVSGGGDSVALAHLVAATIATGEIARSRVVVAHFHHALRGKASDDDATFVAELAKRLSLPFVTERRHRATTERDDSGSLEATLRAARYEFLTRTAQTRAFRYIATAHTRSDQAETVLHRIVRGTGIAGLQAMRPARVLTDAVTLIRPLLHVTHHELRRYLDQIAEPFRDDESNTDERFTRNRLRHNIFPLLRRENPEVEHALARLAEHAAAQQGVIDTLASELLDQAIHTATPDHVTLRTIPLRAAPTLLATEALRLLWRRQRWPLRAMTTETWRRLTQVVVTGGRLTLPGGGDTFQLDSHANAETVTLLRRTSPTVSR